MNTRQSPRRAFFLATRLRRKATVVHKTAVLRLPDSVFFDRPGATRRNMPSTARSAMGRDGAAVILQAARGDLITYEGDPRDLFCPRTVRPATFLPATEAAFLKRRQSAWVPRNLITTLESGNRTGHRGIGPLRSISPQKSALYGCGTQKKLSQFRALRKTSTDNYCRGVTLVEY
jgi:hypothetical protein